MALSGTCNPESRWRWRQTERVDITLQVGSATESITVTSEAPLLKTEDAEVSSRHVGREVSSLPINFSVIAGGYVRSPFVFITNEPGANNTGQNTVRVNGMPNSTESMMVDGQEATNTNSAGGIDELQPSVESIEAVALQTSNYAPEFGQVVGGLFNFNSKSGTNCIHGSAFNYLANDDLNAGVPFTNDGNGHLIRPAVRRNDFGFSVGGPAYIPACLRWAQQDLLLLQPGRVTRRFSTYPAFTRPCQLRRCGMEISARF